MTDKVPATARRERTTTWILKFGSFLLTRARQEGAPEEQDPDGKLAATASHRVLITTAQSSPIVRRIIDDGLPDPCWSFDISTPEGQRGTATGILSHVAFEATWPARNWSPISGGPVPERLILTTDGVVFGVAAQIAREPPFEDAFELGRQGFECLKAIYAAVPGYFVHRVGPFVIEPTVYLVHRPGTTERTATILDELGVAVHITDDENERIEQFIQETISQDADWAIVGYYGAMMSRSEFFQKDFDISTALSDCFALQKQQWSERGWSPKQWLARNSIRRQLRERLSNLYETHAEASEIVNQLRRAARESTDSFAKTYFLAHCSAYTREHLDDCLDWDDSHVLQAARFLEDDLRASSLEQVTLTAAIAGGLVGGLTAILVSVA